MPITRFDRLLPAHGIIAGLLIFVTWIPTGPDTPDDPKVATYYADHQGALTLSAFAAGLACVAILFFAAGIRAALRSTESGEASYSSVAYAGAILVALSGAMNGMLQLGMLDAAHHGHADVVRTLAYFGEFGWLPWVAASAVMLLGTGIGGLRTSALPKWLAIVSIVLGVLCLLGPTGVAVFFAQPVWFIVTGVVLHRRLRTPSARSSAPSGLVAAGV